MQKLKRVLATIERDVSDRSMASVSSTVTTTTTVRTTATSVIPICVGQPYDSQSADHNIYITRAAQSTASSLSTWAATMQARTDETAAADGSEIYLRYDVEHTVMEL